MSFFNSLENFFKGAASDAGKVASTGAKDVGGFFSHIANSPAAGLAQAVAQPVINRFKSSPTIQGINTPFYKPGTTQINPEHIKGILNASQIVGEGSPVGPEGKSLSVESFFNKLPDVKPTSNVVNPQAAEVVNTLAKEHADLLKSIHQETGGVSTIKNAEGSVTGRVSSNDPFYSQFYKENGKAPTNADWLKEAHRQLAKGTDNNSLVYQDALQGLNKPPTPTSPEVTTKSAPEAPKLTDFTPTPTKPEGALSKLALSKGTLVQHQSPELYNLLDQTVGRSQDIASGIAKNLPTVLEVNKKADLRNNFIDVLAGKADPVTPKVAQAVEEWKAVTPQIHGQATGAGLDVGNRGENYFPQNTDYKALTKDPEQLQTAIDHLVSTGQAKTPQEAQGLIQEAARGQSGLNQITTQAPRSGFGGFEQRTLDLPMFKRDANVIPQYIEGASRRIAHAEILGPKYENVKNLLDQVSANGGDVATATKATEQFLNTPQSSKALKQIRGVLSASRLGTTAISHAGQTANTAIEAGFGNTLKAHLQNLTHSEEDFVKKLDVGVESRQLREQQGFEGAAGKVTAPGLKQTMNFNRTVSGLAGKNWADNLAAKGDEASIKILREKLGVTGEIGSKLTEEQQLQAARSLIKSTQFRSSSLDTPLNAETTAGKTIGQFRAGFGYKQTGFMYDQVFKAARQGNIAPLIRAGILLPTVGYGILEAKKGISRAEQIGFNKAIGRPTPDAKPDNSTLAQKAIAGANQAGAFGLPGEIAKGFSNVKDSKGKIDPAKLLVALASTVAPAAGTVADIANRGAQAANGSPGSLERFGLGLTPVVGTQLASALVPTKSSGRSGGSSRSRRVRSSSGRSRRTGRVRVARSARAHRGRVSRTTKVRTPRVRFAKTLTKARVG